VKIQLAEGWPRLSSHNLAHVRLSHSKLLGYVSLTKSVRVHQSYISDGIGGESRPAIPSFLRNHIGTVICGRAQK
jgi:hypothetical protein